MMSGDQDLRHEDGDVLDRTLARSLGPAPEEMPLQTYAAAPSGDFTAAVMARVQAEARSAASSGAGPICFPWRRALPGVGLAALAVMVCAGLLSASVMACVRTAGLLWLPAAMQRIQPALAATAQAGMRLQIGWLMVALALALLPSALTRQLVGKRTYV